MLNFVKNKMMPHSLLCLILLPFVSFASGHTVKLSAFANSHDGHLLAVNYCKPLAGDHAGRPGELRNVMHIYNPSLGLQLHEVVLADRDPVEYIAFNEGNDWLFLQSNHRITVCQAQTGKILHEISLHSPIVQAITSGDALVILLADEMRVYQFSPKKKLLIYKHLPQQPVKVEAMGSYLAVQTAAGSWHFWQTGDTRPLGQIEANQLRYLPQSNQLVTLVQSEQGTSVNRYLLPDLRAPRALVLDNLVPANAQVTLSPGAAFAAVVTNDPNQVRVLHLGQRKWVFNYENGESKSNGQAWQWQSDSLFVAKFGTRFAAIDMADGSFVQFVQFPPLAAQLGEPEHYLSARLDWAISQVAGQELALRSAFTGQVFRYPSTTLLCLRPDRVVVCDQDGNTGSIFLADLLKPGADKTLPTAQYFTRQLPAPSAAALISQRSELLSPAEGAAYKNQIIQQNRPIEEHINSQSLRKLHLRNFIIKNRMFYVNVHLTDAQGNFFTGAAAKDWRQVWNKLAAVPVHSRQALPITDFTLREMGLADSVPCAFALLADHNAAQGPIRPAAIVRAFAQFVNAKREYDAVAMLKYVRNSQVFAPLSKDRRTLLLQLQNLDSISAEPGAALNDAISAAVSQLDKLPQLMQRALVIVSDGSNEKSYLSEIDVLTKVLKKGIRIYTVGFGEKVNDEYLSKLAHITDGEYYYALTEKDFPRIFSDISRRMHQFYQLSFSPSAYGLSRELAEGGLMALVETFGEGPGADLFAIEPAPAGRPAAAKYQHPPKLGDTRVMEIYFMTGKTDIEQKNEVELDQIIQFLADYPFAEIEIRGHTDNIGPEKQNELLSQRRAELVRDLLVGRGVEPYRIRAQGFGAVQPVASNASEAGRAKNRRTELVIVAN